VDLGINENLLYRWIQQAREREAQTYRPSPGHGRPRDEEMTHLREVNEILKKAAVIFVPTDPSEGVSE
jgi:transposase-like protein